MNNYPASFDQVELTMFPSKFVPGGRWGTHAPVSALLQPYEHDVHYLAYIEESATRLQKAEESMRRLAPSGPGPPVQESTASSARR